MAKIEAHCGLCLQCWKIADLATKEQWIQQAYRKLSFLLHGVILICQWQDDCKCYQQICNSSNHSIIATCKSLLVLWARAGHPCTFSGYRLHMEKGECTLPLKLEQIKVLSHCKHSHCAHFLPFACAKKKYLSNYIKSIQSLPTYIFLCICTQIRQYTVHTVFCNVVSLLWKEKQETLKPPNQTP